MSIPAYVVTIAAPSLIFTLLSQPVKRRNILQETALFVLWFAEMGIPIYYAGQFPYLCLISTAAYAWACSMKMGVWLISTMEERRQKPFIYTLLDWRKRTHPITFPAPDDYSKVSLLKTILVFCKHQLIFDTIDFCFNWHDALLPVKCFSSLVSTLLHWVGLTERAAALAPVSPLTYGNILLSITMSTFFCVYIQFQLQVTYDTFMVCFAAVYKLLPILERWQLGQDSKKLNTKNIVQVKAVFRRVRWIRDIKVFIEDTLTMPPLFKNPFSATSLRDFWGKRWHTFYNDAFYRLGYRPIRSVVMLFFNCKPPRWLPALAVFVMSGLMHEYFLLAATGSSVYFGYPLAACGLQLFFFFVQVIAISVGDLGFNKGRLGQMYVIFIMALTSHLFVVPYVLTGYIYMERFSFYRIAVNLYNGNPNIFASIF